MPSDFIFVIVIIALMVGLPVVMCILSYVSTAIENSKKLEEYRKQLPGLQDNIKVLKANNESLKKEYKTLEDNYNSLNKSYLECQKDLVKFAFQTEHPELLNKEGIVMDGCVSEEEYNFLEQDYNELKARFSNLESTHNRKMYLMNNQIEEAKVSCECYKNKINSLEEKIKSQNETIILLKAENEISKKWVVPNVIEGKQNSFIMFTSALYSDLKTAYMDKCAEELDWGHNEKREKSRISIMQLRLMAKTEIERHKASSYQLQYLLALYPGLQDVLDMDYADLQFEKGKIPEHDYTRDYLSKEEWDSLSVSDRNQLALDRYVESHSKTKWQIGRDYEMYIGYTYEQDGWSVQYTGVELGYEDLGRDLIAVRGDETQIVQCKYWSESKVIHEKHVMQLYGTLIAYRIQNPLVDPNKVKGVFVTNIVLSDTASQFAQLLGIVVREKIPKGEFPRIKCNIGKDEFGAATYIYHLPMDLNYDSVKLDKPGECMVFTVREAEEKGFRRAFKWTGT